MATVITVDEETCIIRYGGHNASTRGKENFWVHLYRSEGIRVVIYVKAHGVKDTEFAGKWLPLFKPTGPGTTIKGKDVWMQRWESICEVAIGACKGKVRELVKELVTNNVKDLGADNRGWLTLEGYLRTVAWTLKVVKNEDPGGHDAENGGVVARIIKGPKLVPAYELWPTRLHELPELEDLLPGFGRSDMKQMKHLWPVSVYAARYVQVFGAWADWCNPPRKVRCPNGREYLFVLSENNSRRLGHGTLRNPSRETINAHARIRAYQELARRAGSTAHCRDLRIPGIGGIVVTNVKYDKESHPEKESARLGHAPGAAASTDDNGEPRRMMTVTRVQPYWPRPESPGSCSMPFPTR